jgi:hypothetical protein
MIGVVHPGSRIRMLTFYPSRIQDPRGQKGTRSRIRIRNTGLNPDPDLDPGFCFMAKRKIKQLSITLNLQLDEETFEKSRVFDPHSLNPDISACW